ncbi:hypothetical protein B0H11DRAFT_2207123 [Mycena galericulata]|nr:hypothetical protein B0H11DRAFT_2207123 [Mycena galericulata]
MSKLNRTRTGPHVLFGVQQILDFAEPNCDYLSWNPTDQSLVCTSNMIVAVELMDDQTGQKLLNHSKASRATELAPDGWVEGTVKMGRSVNFFGARSGFPRSIATIHIFTLPPIVRALFVLLHLHPSSSLSSQSNSAKHQFQRIFAGFGRDKGGILNPAHFKLLPISGREALFVTRGVTKTPELNFVLLPGVVARWPYLLYPEIAENPGAKTFVKHKLLKFGYFRGELISL